MYTEVGQGPNGSVLARDNATGETIPILPANAAAMRAYGTLTGGAQGGPGMSMAPSPAGAFTGAPTTIPTGPRPPAPPRVSQPAPLGGRAAGVGNAPLLQNQRVAPSMPAAAAPPAGAQPGAQPKLQSVRRPQGQQQTRVPMPEYEAVRVPGRKAGYVPHSRTTAGIPEGSQTELLQDNEDVADIRGAGIRAQAEAQTSILESQREQAREDAANKRIDADLAQMRASDIQAKNKKIETDLNSQWEALTATKVDRDRVWKDKGWGAGILAAVSIALGEYGAKKAGGQNAAMMMIERMIDRDVEAQRQDLLTRREGLTRKQQHYDRNVYGSENADLEEAKALRWQAVQHEAEERAADKELQLLQPQLLETAALAGEKAMQAKAEILNMRKIQETEAYDRGSPGGVAFRETAKSKATGKAYDEAGKRADAIGKIQKVEAGPGADADTVWVNGSPVGKAANAKELNGQLAAVNGLKRIVNQMKGLNTDGSSLLNSDEYKSLSIEAGYKYMDSIGSPVKSDNDAIAAFELIGGENLASLRPEHRNKILDNVVRRGEGTLQDQLTQRGIYVDLAQPTEEQ